MPQAPPPPKTPAAKCHQDAGAPHCTFPCPMQHQSTGRGLLLLPQVSWSCCSAVCPLQPLQGVYPAALFTEGAGALPAPPSSPPRPWCSSRGCISPSSPVGRGGAGSSGQPGPAGIDLHGLFQEGVLPPRPGGVREHWGWEWGSLYAPLPAGSCELCGRTSMSMGVHVCM